MTRSFFIILLTTISTLPGFTQDDAISRYFNGYLEDDRFTAVYISPMMFRMVASLDTGTVDKDVQQIISDLTGLRILTTEVNPMDRYHEVVQTINTKAYEPLLIVREGKTDYVRFLVKQDGDKISELLMLVANAENFVFMSFTGLIDLARIGALSESLDIQGMSHLKSLKNATRSAGD